MIERRPPWALILAALLLSIVVVLVVRQMSAPRELTSRDATAVTELVSKSVAEARFGDSPAGVIAAGGTLLGPAPTFAVGTPNPEAVVRLADGTVAAGVVRVNEVAGISAVDLRPAGARPTSMTIGSSERLSRGDPLLFAPAGAPTIPANFVGPALVTHPVTGLGQAVIEVALSGAVPATAQGPLFDAEGRLVGLVVPDRQRGALAGRVYAVPAEHAHALFAELGIVANATPEPEHGPAEPEPPADPNNLIE